MAKAKKPKAKAKKEDKLELVLDGKIFILDTKNGKTTKTEIDGTLVLNMLLAKITEAINSYVPPV